MYFPTLFQPSPSSTSTPSIPGIIKSKNRRIFEVVHREGAHVLEERPYLGEERNNGYLDCLEGHYGSIYKKYDIPENCDEVPYGAYDDRILLTVCTIFIYPLIFFILLTLMLLGWTYVLCGKKDHRGRHCVCEGVLWYCKEDSQTLVRESRASAHISLEPPWFVWLTEYKPRCTLNDCCFSPFFVI